jgi:uncharacterized protein YjiS (DUF1127 family)
MPYRGRHSDGGWASLSRFPVAVWIKRSWQRRDLASLDDRILRDIEVIRRDAVRESAKPGWF